MSTIKPGACTVIAGPCSVDASNVGEIYEIAQIRVTDRSGISRRAVAGTRVVGLKSRTELSADPSSMGIDYPALRRNIDIISSGGSVSDFVVPESVLIAERIVRDTGMLVATEIMMPSIQLPAYEGRIPRRMLMPWNPAVNQLGWQIREMGVYAARNDWMIGIKNGKWIGDSLDHADSPIYADRTTMEKTWTGLHTYTGLSPRDTVLIHRGVDIDGKGDFRNYPVHQIAARAKETSGARLYFDPSHTYGPKLRHQIVDATVTAMAMTTAAGLPLYDGVLVEVGTSKTDTAQHISVAELKELVQRIGEIRELAVPMESGSDMKHYAARL